MLKDRMKDALNRQLNRELYSAYLYLAMEAHFESMKLKGFANWMRVQVQEELLHATKFYDFINARDGRVILAEIESPPLKWESPMDAFKKANEHEQKVTEMINDLVDLAIKEKDHATNAFLQWFVTEQVEEEANTDDVVQKLKLVGDNVTNLFELDKELGMRVFVPPAPVAGA